MHARAAAPRRWVLDAGLVAISLALAAAVLWANGPRPETTANPSVEAARDAVRADPLDVGALRDLGLALDRSGDRTEAIPLIELAGERSKRDTATSVWLLQRALEGNRYDEALARADALLRRDIELGQRDRLYALLTAAAKVDAARPALVKALQLRPWWRESFMRALAANGDPDASEAVLASLVRAGSASSPDEAQAFLVKLTADADFARAVRLATGLFGARVLDPADTAAPAPVGWSAVQGAGATSGWDGDRLAVTYDGFASPALPQRLLALAPGAWSLSFRHRTPDAAPPRLKIAVRCAGGATLAQTAPLSAASTWRAETLVFTVPAAGCAAQWLAILADPGERAALVETDFTGWRIDPSSGPLPR